MFFFLGIMAWVIGCVAIGWGLYVITHVQSCAPTKPQCGLLTTTPE